MSIQQIEDAIANLPTHELAKLMRWMGEYVAAQMDQNAWDAQITENSKNGKLDNLFNDAMTQIHNGQVSDL